MVARHRKDGSLSQSGHVCGHCGNSYWDLLPACPYCGSINKGCQSEGSRFGESQPAFADCRKAMHLFSNNFYYVFLLLSFFCAIIIFIHDVPENMINHLGGIFESFQRKTQYLFWILYPIQQIMFSYWLMKHYDALSSLRIRKRFSSMMAWTTFIPILNLYYPQAMVQELEDRLYYLRVPRLNIRFVPIWWFFQSIVYLYMLFSVFGVYGWLADNGLFWLVIVIELIWGVAILCQGYLLYGFMSSVYSGVSRHDRRLSRSCADSTSARRGRHRRTRE